MAEAPTSAVPPPEAAPSEAQTATRSSADHNVAVVPHSGRRQALRDLRRTLTEEDLASPGVQKMLLDELERADAQLEVKAGFEGRFYDADKRAAVLEFQLRGATALEVMFGVGLAVGGAIFGLAPSFWNDQPKGWVTLAVGSLLMIGSVVGRVVKR